MYIYRICNKSIVKLDVALITPSIWHPLANISTVSSSRSSSRAEVLLQFDGKNPGKFHCAEYVIETTGRPDKNVRKC